MSSDDINQKDTLLGNDGKSIEAKASQIIRGRLLPILSQVRYQDAWAKFMEWKERLDEKPSTPDENMLLVYLDELSNSFAPSSLWTIYSMLKRQMMVIRFLLYLFIRFTTMLINSPG
jgi:hypothetical protein